MATGILNIGYRSSFLKYCTGEAGLVACHAVMLMDFYTFFQKKIDYFIKIRYDIWVVIPMQTWWNGRHATLRGYEIQLNICKSGGMADTLL